MPWCIVLNDILDCEHHLVLFDEFDVWIIEDELED